jgi:hypothetical protein
MNRASLLTLLLLILGALGGGWFLMNGTPTVDTLGLAPQPEAASAEVGASTPSARQLVHEKAVIASVLAAVYAAERGAKITQIEAMVAAMQGEATALSPEQRAEMAKIEALLPDNKRERDASYALYFQGITALATADAATADAALKIVETELTKAGLTRLVRYIPPIRTQLVRARSQPVTPADQPALVTELENALRNGES